MAVRILRERRRWCPRAWPPRLGRRLSLNLGDVKRPSGYAAGGTEAKGRTSMHRINTVIAIVLLVVIAIFAVQNTGSVTVTLLTTSLTAPLALVAIGVYVLGMLTGSTLFAALRRPMRDRGRS